MMSNIKISNVAHSSYPSFALAREQGLALPLTLILLLVMTLIGIATLRSTTMEENMTANSRLRQIAFNAAETTLREAEGVVETLGVAQTRARFIGQDPDTGEAKKRPIDGEPNRGDTCEGGFCTPAQFTQSVTGPLSPDFPERWEDPDLDVWTNPDRHIEYSDFVGSNLALNGIIEAPKYIIEFLGNYDYREANSLLNSNPNVRPKLSGNYRGGCRDPQTDALTSPNNEWPFCATDPALFRVTVRATAGPPARQAIVTLQSTIRIP